MLRATVLAGERGLHVEADQRAQVTLGPEPITLFHDHCRDGVPQLLPRGGRAIRVLQNAGLRLDHLAQRPERDTGPVRERPSLPPGDEVGERVDVDAELDDEPRLADPWWPHERHELCRRFRARAGEQVAEQVGLAFTADQSELIAHLFGHERARLERQPRRDALLLALRLDRVGGLVADDPGGRSVGRFVDERAAGRSRRLQARGRVDHHIARGIELAGPAEQDQRLAARDADAHAQPRGVRRSLLQLRDARADREPCADCPLGIVLVGRAEDGQHAVAGEVRDDTAARLDLTLQQLLVRAHQHADVLDVDQLGTAREAHQVGGQHADDAPLAPLARGRRKRGTTRHAKACLGRLSAPQLAHATTAPF